MTDAPDPIALICERLDVPPELAEDILLLTHWVDQELATTRYGYPKDNAIPPPLHQRLADPAYLARLRHAACDHWELTPDRLPF
ncbi:hypothetical protein DL240_14410 [Lujinxingia litoralis]|uniref:Uncharacterized protein n=1 Tax=Lujinxingia litoralis TaxID=2211119 RepID=A0A328C8B2_9DELT|nr:hypothetical protein [Lujinxingia litoralis]RAL20873.1 hypothetical protein DL240_14410 [Lujinxingia litoralis]